jgi:hypothetical protein
MKTGITFAAVPKDRSGLTSTLGVSSIAAFAGSAMLIQTFGVTGLIVTGAAGVLSTSLTGITSARKRKKAQRSAINTVLTEVLHSDVRISDAQTSDLLSGRTLTFRQGEAETMEISYLGASGEATSKRGKQEPYTGLINIECNRDPFDGVKSFDSILTSLAEQNSPQIMNAAQRRIVQDQVKNNKAADKAQPFFGPDEWLEASDDIMKEIAEGKAAANRTPENSSRKLRGSTAKRR